MLFRSITSGQEVFVRLKYLVDSADSLSQMQKNFNDQVDSILAQMPDSGDFEKELFLHDYLIRQVEYSDAAAADSSGENAFAFTAYGAIINKSAVCEGYARAMQLLLNKAGIGCYLITGKVSGTDHMWNIVTIDGARYHLDATWNDSIKLTQNQELSHLYFNVTDEAISADHTDFIPQGCDSKANNYFVRMNRYFTYYDSYVDDVITQEMIKCAQIGERLIEFSFHNQDSFGQAYDALITQSGVFSLIENANKSLTTVKIKPDSLQLGSSSEKNNILTLIIDFS